MEIQCAWRGLFTVDRREEFSEINLRTVVFLFSNFFLSFLDKNIWSKIFKDKFGKIKKIQEKIWRDREKTERESFTKSIEKNLKRKTFTSKIKKLG